MGIIAAAIPAIASTVTKVVQADAPTTPPMTSTNIITVGSTDGVAKLVSSIMAGDAQVGPDNAVVTSGGRDLAPWAILGGLVLLAIMLAKGR